MAAVGDKQDLVWFPIYILEPLHSISAAQLTGKPSSHLVSKRGWSIGRNTLRKMGARAKRIEKLCLLTFYEGRV